MCVEVQGGEGVMGGGGSPAFCHGTLDKTKTTHFSGPLPHLVFRNKSGLWLQGPDNTSSLPLSLGCCGGGGGGPRGGVVVVVGGFTPDRPCHSNAKPQLPQIHPSCPPPPLPPPFYYFVGFHSYFWMDGLSRPRISTGDMSSKPGHLPMQPLT